MAFSAHHLFFDDLETSAEWKSPGRTITEADIMTYAGFSADFNPMHIDEEFAKKTPYRKRIAHGFGIFGIASGLGVQAPLVRIIALTGVRWWKFSLPVFIGDTIHVNARVVEKTVKGRGRRGEVVWYRGIVSGGLFNVRLEGSGMIAITTHYDPLTLRVTPGKPVFTDPNATVAWSGSLAPELKTDVSLKTFFGRGSGESIQMKFEGDGFVVVQPFEETPMNAAGG